MQATRRSRGSTLGITAVLTFCLVVLFLGIAQISMLIGGSEDTSDAVDAGALAVGQGVFTIKVSPRDPDEHEFDDVADSQGKFSITNINRVWGKALLCCINVAAMEHEGTSSGFARLNAGRMFAAATRLNNRLADKLNDPENLYGFFNAITARNTTNLLGKSSKVIAKNGANWKASFVDRGKETGMKIDLKQLPKPFNLEKVAAVKGEDGKTYLSGYNVISVLGNGFNFVPMRVDQKPHLIGAKEFEENKLDKKPFLGLVKPIPNAFSVEGKSVNHDVQGASSVSHVVVNPQRSFHTSMPHSFIRINFEKNKVQYLINGIPMWEDSYQFLPEVKVAGPFPVGTGTTTITANLGNEYIPPTLFKAIFALPSTDQDKIIKTLVQRLREIHPAYGKSDLLGVLNATPLIPGVREYVLLPSSEGGPIVAAPLPDLGSIHPWLKKIKRADGQEKNIGKEIAVNAPNSATQILSGSGCKPGPVITTTVGEIKWKPGSGMGGCLGELNIERTTRVLATGICTGL